MDEKQVVAGTGRMMSLTGPGQSVTKLLAAFALLPVLPQFA